jgi:DNA polymerase-4
MGFRTIGQLAAVDRESLVTQLGSLGEHLYHLSHGHDERPVIPNWEPKSISSETTFDEDTDDRQLLLQTILDLSDHVAERLRKDGYRARKSDTQAALLQLSPHTRSNSPSVTGTFRQARKSRPSHAACSATSLSNRRSG